MGGKNSAYGPLAKALSRGTREKTHKYLVENAGEKRQKKRKIKKQAGRHRKKERKKRTNERQEAATKRRGRN